MMSYRTMCSPRYIFGVSAFALCLAASIVATPGAEVTYALRIENGHVPENMRLIRVTQGDVVKLQWSADKPSVVHLHGYDIERRVVPGVVTDLAFTARATGRFPVNLPRSETGSPGHRPEATPVPIEPPPPPPIPPLA